MKKVILGMFVFALFASVSVFAETNSTRPVREAREVKTVDISCVSTAVTARETAVLSSWSKLNTQVTKVLEARKTALVAAWSITDAKERRVELKKAWTTAKKERKEGTTQYKKEKKEAWATFKTAAKACGGSVGSEAAGESEAGEKIEI